MDEKGIRRMLSRVLCLGFALTGTAAIAQDPAPVASPEPAPPAAPKPITDEDLEMLARLAPVQAPPPIIWLAAPPASGSLESPEGPERGPVLTLFVPPPPNPNAVALPPAARAVLEQAMKTGDAATFAAVEKAAREQYPDGASQIDALAAKNAAQIAEKQASDARAKAEALAEASFLDNWKGEVSLGGSYTKGNSDAVSVYGAFKLNKEGLRWRHALSARADYAKSSGELSTDKDTAAYQPQYKLGEKLYAYGLGQFDRDEILGIQYRFTEAVGLGYTLARDTRFKVAVEAGPALRESRYISGERDTRPAGRGSVNFDWKPNPNLELTNQSAVFFEKADTNITSTTALTSRLFGPIKGQISYNLTYEDDVPGQAKSFDTITAASLVYSF
jgi:putative salt-induced outer membrane protein